MPAKPEWLLRLPEIRAELEHLDVSVVDRAGIEHLFGLRRRRAIELMHQFGGYQAGRTFLLDRARLLEALQSLELREDYAVEKRRRERLGDVVEASREHLLSIRVRIPVRATAARASLDRLAPGVLLLPGILTIEFRHPIELLEKLYGLAQAIGHDFERFEELLPGGGKMADDLDGATRCARTVALLHPTSIHRAPIGMYYLYEDRHIRVRVSDQIDLDDFGVWSRAHGDEWIELFRWSPYMAESERPQVFVPGDWIPYLRALAACRSRELLDWRAAHWNPGAPRLSKRRDYTALLAM